MEIDPKKEQFAFRNNSVPDANNSLFSDLSSSALLPNRNFGHPDWDWITAYQFDAPVQKLGYSPTSSDASTLNTVNDASIQISLNPPTSTTE